MKSWAAYKKELLSLHSTPHELALGFAVGTFIGVLPTPFFSVLLAFFVIFLYPKMSKATLFGAIILWNPLITIPLSVISYRIGDLLFGAAPVVNYDVVLLERIYNFTRRFLVGNVILSASLAAIGYGLTFGLSTLWKKRSKKS